MDIQILAFFFLIGLALSVLGYLFKNRNLAGIALFAFAFTGLAILFNGIDVNSLASQRSNFTSVDTYFYNWNSTFNQSSIANVSTTFNRTDTMTYQYANTTDSYTSTFAAILIGAGILIGLEAYLRSSKDEDA